MMTVLLIILALLLALILIFVSLYNSLMQVRNEVRNSWMQIDALLKRRYELIPNLIDTAKNDLKRERDSLEAVTRMRQQALSVSPDHLAARATIENMLADTIKSLFVVTENYPDLKANPHFQALHEELAATENKIGLARQSYNDAVLRLKRKMRTFPTSLLAGLFKFKEEASFAADEDAGI